MKLPAGAKLLTQTLSLSGARVVGSGANFFAQLLLAHSMNVNDLGLFYIITSIVIFLGAVASIGYPGISNQLMVRYVSRHQDWKMKTFILTARRDTLIIALCVALAGVVAITIGSDGDSRIIWPSVIAALAIPALTTLRVNGGIANALQRFALSTLPDNLIRPVLFTLVIGALVLMSMPLTLLNVVCAFSALVIAIALTQTLIVGWSGGAAGRDRKPDRREAKHWRKSGVYMLVPVLIIGLFADLVIIISGVLLESSQVAIFSICIKIAFMFGFFIQVLYQISLPHFTKALRAKDQAGVAELLTKINAVAVAMMIGALLATWIAGRELLGVIGTQFQAGYSVLLILVAAQLIRALGGPALTLLIASGRHKLAIPPIAVSVAVFIAVAFALAPMLGTNGMALAVVAAMTVSGIGLAVVVRRELGFSCDALSRFKPGLPSISLIAGRLSERKLS